MSNNNEEHRNGESTELATGCLSGRQVVSKTLVQNPNVSLTLFSFDKGEDISTHLPMEMQWFM